MDSVFYEISRSVGVWISEGSGWIIDSVKTHFINVCKFNPLRESSFMKLPKELSNSRKGLVNIQNIDNECFRWCHLANKFPADANHQRVMKYVKHLSKLHGLQRY